MKKQLRQKTLRPIIIFSMVVLGLISVVYFLVSCHYKKQYVLDRVFELGGIPVRENNFITETPFLEETHCFNVVKQIEIVNPGILGIKYPDITEEDMKMFGQCKELERLLIVCDNISDEWLIHLINLKKLNSLHIYSEGISDEAFKYLSQIKSLKDLVIRSSAIKGEGLRELIHLPKLVYVEIDSRSMTDKGAIHLSKCHHIEYVSVCFSKVTDRGLKILCQNKSLKRLNVLNTQVTQDSVFQQETLNPQIEIYSGTSRFPYEENPNRRYEFTPLK